MKDNEKKYTKYENKKPKPKDQQNRGNKNKAITLYDYTLTL